MNELGINAKCFFKINTFFPPFSFLQPRVTNESDIFLSFTVNLNLIMSRRIHLGSYHVSVCLQVFVQ